MFHQFPYHDFPPLEIPEANLLGIYRLVDVSHTQNNADLVRSALDSPIGCPKLSETVAPGMRIVIAVDDSSRSTRTDVMLPSVLTELREAGIPPKDITVFVALGTHRRMTRDELKLKYTSEAVSNYRFVNPDWKDCTAYHDLALSSRNFPIRIHQKVLRADYLIGVGQTVPHMIAGFGGGGKIINPGCADADTIGQMHWLCHEVPPDCLFAVRDNPVREVIDEAALKAGLRFIVNEVPGGNRLAGVFAGHPVLAHRHACNFARKALDVKIPQQADIVISDAYPADLDFWQALKGLNAACRAVRKGGTVVLVTPCWEGACAQHPELTSLGYIPIRETIQKAAQDQLDKCVAGNLYLGRQLLDHAHIILVTKGIPEKETRAMGFDWATNPEMALKGAFARCGPSARIAVLYKAAKMICQAPVGLLPSLAK